MTALAGVSGGSGTESAQVGEVEPKSAEAGGPIAEKSREQSPEVAAEPDAVATGVAEAELRPAELDAAELDAAELDAAELDAAELDAAELDAAEPEATHKEMAGTEMAEPPAEREAERDMSPLAVVGVIVCVIALVGVAAGALVLLTHGFHKKTVVTVKYKAAAVFSLRPGDCINTGAGVAFTRVACSTPHDAEVFATFSLTGSSWPGTKAVQADAGNGCATRLSGYLNPALATAALAQAYVYPDQSAWQASERIVICEVSSSTGKLTGSVGNSA
jgi:Septum formation